MQKTDQSGVVNCAVGETCYLGHSSIAGVPALVTACRAIVRLAATKMGIQISNFNEDILSKSTTDTQQYGTAKMTYQYHDGDNIIHGGPTAYAIAAEDTWETLANELYTDVLTIWRALSVENRSTFKLEAYEIFANAYNTIDTENQRVNIPLVRLYLIDADITISCSSKLLIQNRTRAEDAAGDEHHVATNHVEANPIHGKAYEINGTDTFQMRGVTASTTGWNLTPDYNAGRIHAESDDSNAPAHMKLPPHPKAFFKCNKSRRVFLNPGCIKRSDIRSYHKLPLNSFFRKMKGVLDASAADMPNWIGKARMFAFHKMMHVEANDPALELGYEIHHFIGAIITCKRQVTPAVLNQVGVAAAL